jgi:putative ABC transport system substrate-binding protein
MSVASGSQAALTDRREELAVSAAGMAYKTLNGASPSDMALSQAKGYELIVNLRTANALGVTVPRALLVSANKVIR